MSANSQASLDGFEPMRSAGGTSSVGPRQSYRGHLRRQSSATDPIMATIDENVEQDFSDTRPLAQAASDSDAGEHYFTNANINVTQTEVPQSAKSPSLLRRLSTKLGPKVSGHRPWPSQRRHYATVEDSAEIAPVDLSSLEGLGIELQEVTSPEAMDIPSLESQDTSYRGADHVHKPSFSEFRKKRTLGMGMLIGAQLQRDLSQLDRSNHPDSRQESLRRMRTVRQLGQNLAEERGQMVAYSEAIDLSSLEGAGLRFRQSATFDDMSLSHSSTMPDTKSYFFPSDPQIPNWRPFSMRAPWIVMLTCIAFGLAAFQEWLCQASMRKQGEEPPTALLAFDSVDEVSVGWFFVWKYLPTMITIFYSILYSIMDFDIRRLEPYYQLSRPQGARAAASLNLDHLTMFQYFVPFNAARMGQWAVLASTFANIIAATIAPALQNPSVNFQLNPACPHAQCPDPKDERVKRFWVLIDPIWSRLLTASYATVGAVLVFLFFQLRRKSGLLSDPKGIAGIASMATKSHILHDFKGLDTGTRSDIHKRLAHRTYVLYKSSIWQGEFTLQPDKNEFHDSPGRLRSPHPIMLRLEAGRPFIIAMALCLIFVPIISLTPARIVPNTVPWLPILVATILKLIWTTFEADFRMIEPFYRLSKGNARPEHSLTLDYQSTVYGWMPVRAVFNKHYLVALVGLSTVLLDVLSVTIGSFSVDSVVFLKGKAGQKNDNPGKTGPSSQGETYVSFWVSLALSVGILIFVISVACLVYARRRHPFLPREPSTIASVLSFIYASNMLTDFIDTELLDSKAMENRLKALNKRYALGWFKGRDGKVHCAIDEEPLVSTYIHGKPYSAAVSGPLADHETSYYT